MYYIMKTKTLRKNFVFHPDDWKIIKLAAMKKKRNETDFITQSMLEISKQILRDE